MSFQRLAVSVEAADDEEAATLALRLQRELLELDVGVVQSAPGAEPPPGAKGDALTWAQLTVEIAGSLSPLLELVRSWVRRNDSAAVTIVMDDDRLELSAATTDQQTKLIAAWLARQNARASNRAPAERLSDRDESL